MTKLQFITVLFLTLCCLPDDGLGHIQADAPVVLLRNVTLIDGMGNPAVSGVNIVIEESYIKDIFRNGEEGHCPVDSVLDLSGCYVLPGLIDGHVHITGRDEACLSNALHWGITSLRDMAGDGAYLKDLTERIQSGEVESPTIYYSALLAGNDFMNTNLRVKMITPDEYDLGQAPWCRSIGELSGIGELIAEAGEWGISGVKMYAYLDPIQVQNVVREAESQGLKTWSHSVLYPAGCLEIVTAGVDVISHINGLLVSEDWNYEKDAGCLVFDSGEDGKARFDRILDEMKNQGTLLDPTLSIFEQMVRMRVPDKMRSETLKTGFSAVRRAYLREIPVVAGTDLSLPENRDTPPILFHELELYVNEVGMSEEKAIACATLNAAKALGVEQICGSVQVGKVADLVVLRKNPCKNIRNLKKVKMVLKHGKIVYQST